MLKCSVCGGDNDDFAVICLSCGSFVQGTIQVLDLFATIWGLIEAPRATFRRIALSRRKTYLVFLSSLSGIYLASLVFRFENLAHQLPDFTLFVAGFISGPPFGLLCVCFIGCAGLFFAKIIGGKGNLKNNIAVTSYAMVPLTFLLVFVVPVELALFGIDLFGDNPSPMMIRPGMYRLLLGFDSAGLFWSFLLLAEGMAVANSLSRWKGYVVAFLAVAFFLGGAALIDVMEPHGPSVI
jgi:hypothetical protein